MKRVLRFAAILVTVVVALAGAALAWLALRKPAQQPASAETIEHTPARLARGEYLVEHVLDCFGCHGDRDFTRYGGPVKEGMKGIGGFCLDEKDEAPGRICFPNITPDREAGIGSWTDGEVLRALREGVDREGRALFPMMPYGSYRQLSDEDARAVVAYVRSIPPVARTVPATRIAFPVNLFIKFAPAPVTGPVPGPSRDDRLAYGRYLTEVGGCRFCHSQTEKGQPLPGREFAGGQEFSGPFGRVVSANLTPDATGLGPTSRESFIALFRSFADPAAQAPVDPQKNTVMPWLAAAGMAEEDLGAIYDYLRTVPPVENRVERRPRPTPPPSPTVP